MDCGTPFCHMGCPLGNVIPDWNTHAWAGRWEDAIERLHATNNFPEFTGRLCPAPCESACVLGINQEPVKIRNVEQTSADTGWETGRITPQVPKRLTGRTVAVIGSGPAGLAAAQQLTRAGHTVAVFERDDAPGGLLRYGIPQFKLEKSLVDRRLEQMRAEGTRFHTGVAVGEDLAGDELLERFDAVVLAMGSRVGRDLRVSGRELAGIHQAVEYLTASTKRVLGLREEGFISAEGKRVVVIGGGDTGSDCVGTAIRQGAASVTSLEIMPRLPERRSANDPWPTFPRLYTVSSSHEEGGERVYSTSTAEILGDEDGRVRALRLVDVRMDRGASLPSRAPSARSRPIWSSSPWASPESRPGASSPSSASRSTGAGASSATPRGRPHARACSSAATRGAASRSSSGRSPKAAQRRPPSTPICGAAPSCRARSSRRASSTGPDGADAWGGAGRSRPFRVS